MMGTKQKLKEYEMDSIYDKNEFSFIPYNYARGERKKAKRSARKRMRQYWKNEDRRNMERKND